MQPFYQDQWTTIYNADCRDVLPILPKVDLVLTDYPYANHTNYDIYNDTLENLQQLINDTMPMILSKTQRALITCGVANIQLFPKPEWILSWVNPAGAGSGKWGFCCWQPILAYGKDPYLTNGLGRRPDTIIKNEITDKFIDHPCPKPKDFWQMLLLRGSIYTNDTILDPFLGGGTTAVASKSLGRKCIGIEISEKYCEETAKRCMQSVMEFDKPTENIEQGCLL